MVGFYNGKHGKYLNTCDWEKLRCYASERLAWSLFCETFRKYENESQQGLPGYRDCRILIKEHRTLDHVIKVDGVRGVSFSFIFKAKLTGGDYLPDLECKKKREAASLIHILFDLIKKGSYFLLTWRRLRDVQGWRKSNVELDESESQGCLTRELWQSRH